ncbi:MAG: thioredoxin family protein [Pirellulales bacterium]|nr:thioredoxin family protein [Pirellulales bacterium]
MRGLMCSIGIWLLLAAACLAGEYNDVLNIGDAAPAWSDLPGVDGKQHSLADLQEKQVVVVVFTCNSCPVAVDYEDRIVALAKKHTGEGAKVALVAINVNKIEADRLDKMQERAASKGFNFPYLYDQSQQIAKQYGANFTPEFFVLDRDRKIVYMGGMDDNSNPALAKNNYLEPAIAAALTGVPPQVKETVARGCRIRYERERRQRK